MRPPDFAPNSAPSPSMALFRAAAVFLTALPAACAAVRGLRAVFAPAFGCAFGAGACGAVSAMSSSNMALRSSAGGASSLALAFFCAAAMPSFRLVGLDLRAAASSFSALRASGAGSRPGWRFPAVPCWGAPPAACPASWLAVAFHCGLLALRHLPSVVRWLLARLRRPASRALRPAVGRWFLLTISAMRRRIAWGVVQRARFRGWLCWCRCSLLLAAPANTSFAP